MPGIDGPQGSQGPRGRKGVFFLKKESIIMSRKN